MAKRKTSGKRSSRRMSKSTKGMCKMCDHKTHGKKMCSVCGCC